jgi:hypothetical protein
VSKRVLVIEDSRSAAGRLVRALRSLGSEPVHISYIESMVDGTLNGWSDLAGRDAVVVQVASLDAAYIDYDLGPCRFSGRDVVTFLLKHGLKRVVGMSSDTTFNARLRQAGARRTRSKMDLISRLEAAAERGADALP